MMLSEQLFFAGHDHRMPGFVLGIHDRPGDCREPLPTVDHRLRSMAALVQGTIERPSRNGSTVDFTIAST